MEIAMPSEGLAKRPDCQAPNCEHPKESAMVLFMGKWVCGECAMKKNSEMNKMVWG